VPGPEEAANETRDGSARLLSELDDVRRLRSYAYRVARYVLRERLRTQAAPAAAARVAGRRGAEEKERRLGCLARCLSALAGEERDLVVAYYRTSGGEVEDRRGLAGRLGLTPAALRTRAYRLRLRLELCLGGCLQRREGR